MPMQLGVFIFNRRQKMEKKSANENIKTLWEKNFTP